jgi:hypothetical protein
MGVSMTDEIQTTPAAACPANDITPPPPATESEAAKPTAPLIETAGGARATLNVMPDVSATLSRATEASGSAATASVGEAPGNRFALLAASVAFAAALGAVAGGLGASGFTRSAAPAGPGAITAGATENTDALQNMMNRMQTELAALRTSVEASTRASNGQFSKIAERFDRVERTQTERAAKLIKGMESLERVERRAEATPAREITGSVPAPQPVAATSAQPPQHPQAAHPPQPPIVEGWVVRNVYRGTAIIQHRRIGTVDVEPGDILQGVGRIESIKKQDGQWVVVTSKGLITSMR